MKNGLIFRVWIKNESRYNSRLKKGVQIGPKLKRKFGTQEGLSALLECWLSQICDLARGLPD